MSGDRLSLTGKVERTEASLPSEVGPGIGRGHRRSADGALPWSPRSLSCYLAGRVDCARTGDPVLLSQMDPRQGLSSWSWASKGTGDKVPGRTQHSTCF